MTDDERTVIDNITIEAMNAVEFVIAQRLAQFEVVQDSLNIVDLDAYIKVNQKLFTDACDANHEMVKIVRHFASQLSAPAMLQKIIDDASKDNNQSN